MRVNLIAAILSAGLTALASTDGKAADVKVLSIPLRTSLDKISPLFERTTGHKLSVTYAPSSPLMKQIDAGELFDLVIIFPAQIDDLIKRGKVVAGSRADLARSGIGVAVRKGAARPDIGQADALKKALLDAKSISYASDGPSGIYFSGLMERLGIEADIRPKLRPVKTGSEVVAPVGKGAAEIGIVSIPFILADPDVELVGPLPRELQHYVVYSSGVGTGAREAGAARALINFLSKPDAISIMKTNGLEPVEAR